MSQKESVVSIPCRAELLNRLVIVCGINEIVAKVQELLGKSFKMVLLVKHNRNEEETALRDLMVKIAEKVYAYTDVSELKGGIVMHIKSQIKTLFETMYCIVKLNDEIMSFDVQNGTDISISKEVTEVQEVLSNPVMLTCECVQRVLQKFDLVAFLF